MRRLSLSEAEIARLLARAEGAENSLAPTERSQNHSYASLQRAAVLVPLLRREGEWHLLFTHRAETVAQHRGEVAFPGGACQEGETAEQTALRETEEETGLSPDSVRILGRLREIVTSSGYRVTPVVGRIPWPCELRLALQEVSRAFTIPLPWLAQRRNWRTVPYTPPHGGAPFPVVVYRPYAGEILWGVSARIVHAFLSVLGLLRA